MCVVVVLHHEKIADQCNNGSDSDNGNSSPSQNGRCKEEFFSNIPTLIWKMVEQKDKNSLTNNKTTNPSQKSVQILRSLQISLNKYSITTNLCKQIFRSLQISHKMCHLICTSDIFSDMIYQVQQHLQVNSF